MDTKRKSRRSPARTRSARKSARKSTKRTTTPAIRLLIATKGFTQAAIARKTGIHESYISRIFAGERSPRMKIVQPIARVLGVSCDRLMKSISLSAA